MISNPAPAKNGRPEHQGRPGETPGDRKPGSDRGDGQREAQKELSSMSEAFCQRIEEDYHQRDGREGKANRVDEPGRCDEQNRGGHTCRNGEGFGDEFVPPCRTGIPLVDFPIRETIERHRCGARQDHCKYDQSEDAQRGEPMSCHKH